MVTSLECICCGKPARYQMRLHIGDPTPDCRIRRYAPPVDLRHVFTQMVPFCESCFGVVTSNFSGTIMNLQAQNGLLSIGYKKSEAVT